MPNEKQLKQTIEQGNDSADNVLILKKDGNFELIQGAGAGAGAVSGLDYVTRWNTFDQGNGWVGKGAAKDKNHINRIINWAEKAWEKYTTKGYAKITNLTE